MFIESDLPQQRYAHPDCASRAHIFAAGENCILGQQCLSRPTDLSFFHRIQ